MEKPTSNKRRKRYNRLLRLFIYMVYFLCVFCMHAQDFASYQFSQVNDFSVSTDSEFILDLVGVAPSETEIGRFALPPGVSFVSLTKKDGFVRNEIGMTQKATTISYKIRFAQEGKYDLGSLPIIIDSTLQTIDFPVVVVSPNPNILIPELYIEQNSSLYELRESIFTLYGRYFKTVEGVSLELSEHALIEQKEVMIDMPSSDFTFSASRIPLVVFSCTPFNEGSFELPEIRVSFTAYNGTPHEILLDKTTFDVLNTSSVSFLYGEERKLFGDGFIEKNEAFINERKEDFVKELADLRIREKYELFPFAVTEERIALESRENIEGSDEVSYPVVIALIGISIASLFIALVLYLYSKKNERRSFSLYVMLLCMTGLIIAGGTFVYGKTLLKQEALTFGAQLYTIPEYEAKVVASLHAGTKVTVQHSAGDWYLIVIADGRSGWIQKTDCILIEKIR